MRRRQKTETLMRGSDMIIDVSSHNGAIDWQKVKGNVEAAVIRMGYRGYTKGTIAYDAKYKANRAACEQLGIPFSLYFFPCSVTDLEAIEEADFIIRECVGMKYVLPVFLDSEVAETKFGSGRADNLSRADRTRFLRIICERMQAAGIPAGIYASKAWFSYNLDLLQLPYSIWVAQWSSNLTFSRDYVLWQYSDSGLVPGIPGRVDVSRRPSESKTDSALAVSDSISTGLRTVTASVLNVRQDPDAGSADLGDLVKGSKIMIDEVRDGWAHFSGWVSEQYLSNCEKVQEFSLAKDGDTKLSDNFTVREFRCKDGSDKILIDLGFVKEKLQAIRDHFGAAVTINSGYRTESYNAKVGGANGSYHMKGQAFDIVVKGHTPQEVARYAQEIGIPGIIQYNTFVHVDSREKKYWARNDNGKVSVVTAF